MKTWDQFYIEYMIKRSKPYYMYPGWALAYNPWCPDFNKYSHNDSYSKNIVFTEYFEINTLIS